MKIVAGLIFCKNKLLLVHHINMDLWMPVAGHVEKNESCRDALKREIKEETGLGVEIADKPFYSMKELKGTTPHYICHTKNSKVKLKKDELTDYRWMSKKEIEKSNLDKIVKKIALKSFAAK